MAASHSRTYSCLQWGFQAHVLCMTYKYNLLLITNQNCIWLLLSRQKLLHGSEQNSASPVFCCFQKTLSHCSQKLCWYHVREYFTELFYQRYSYITSWEYFKHFFLHLFLQCPRHGRFVEFDVLCSTFSRQQNIKNILSQAQDPNKLASCIPQ